MKPYVRIGWLLLLGLWAVAGLAQTTIQSNGTGGGRWDTVTTWQGGVVPGTLDSVVIRGTDSVYFSQLVPDTCGSLTVLTGGKLATVATTDSILVVSNVFTLAAGATYFNGSSNPRVPGSTRVIDQASTVVHRGSSTVGGPGNLEFGNLTIQEAQGQTAGGDLIIHGNLSVENSAVGNTFRAITRTMAGSRTCTVKGNVYVRTGQFSCVDYGSDSTIGATWNIDGDVFVLGSTARIMTFTSAFATGKAVFNIKGDLTVNGGRLSAGSSGSRGYGTGIINLGGDFTLTGGGYTTTNHKGALSFNFVGTGLQTVKLDTNFSFGEEPVFDTVATGANVVFDLGHYVWSSMDTLLGTGGGAFVVNGTLALKDSSRLRGRPTFTLNPGATLKIGKNDGITVLPDSSNGNVQVTGLRTYSPLANYEYFGSEYQETGDGLPASVNNLTINNPNDVKLKAPVTVNGALAVQSGDFRLNGNTLTLGPTATITETAGNTCHGTVEATRTLAQSTQESFGGLGISINAAGAAPGVTTVTRVTEEPQTGLGGNSSIARYFDISAATNTGLNASMDFGYDASELNGLNAASMELWRSPDGGSTWNDQPSVNTPAQFKLSATGVGSFSRWTASDATHPLGYKTATVVIPVLQRWNMVSNPLRMPDNSTTVLFPSASSSAFKFVPGVGYSTSAAMNPGSGYWLKFPAAENVQMTGGTISADTIDVEAGWNLIGSITIQIPTTQVFTIGTTITSVFYKYNQGYLRADDIKPGEAYWVKVDQAGQLVLVP